METSTSPFSINVSGSDLTVVDLSSLSFMKSSVQIFNKKRSELYRVIIG
jgi:hypothetical protein